MFRLRIKHDVPPQLLSPEQNTVDPPRVHLSGCHPLTGGCQSLAGFQDGHLCAHHGGIVVGKGFLQGTLTLWSPLRVSYKQTTNKLLLCCEPVLPQQQRTAIEKSQAQIAVLSQGCLSGK